MSLEPPHTLYEVSAATLTRYPSAEETLGRLYTYHCSAVVLADLSLSLSRSLSVCLPCLLSILTIFVFLLFLHSIFGVFHSECVSGGSEGE